MKASARVQPSNCKYFRLTDFLAKEEVFHIARVFITTRYDISYHSHDYAELFWVESGEGTHHINGNKITLHANDMVLIRPSDRHTFSSNGKNLTIVNIAFPKETLDYFHDRYFANSNQYFWSDSVLPYQIKIPDSLVKRFSYRAEEAMQFKRSNMQMDSLLLFIFRKIQELDTQQDYSSAPSWLASAIKAYNNTTYFKYGSSSFVQLCAKNPDYVNRMVKMVFKQTLTEFVNDIRIKYAANELILTSIPIKLISYSCGFESIAYFYKQFGQRYGQTPSDYRKMHQKIV
ncbi:MAG: helix-turn-helix transcriptional regulator [Bacteroidales bacterium]|nr:helix-turn-helix transcriptional regulator [Bacteroidales bacterium]